MTSKIADFETETAPSFRLLTANEIDLVAGGHFQPKNYDKGLGGKSLAKAIPQISQTVDVTVIQFAINLNIGGSGISQINYQVVQVL